MLIFNNFYPNIDHKLVLALVLVLNSCYFEKNFYSVKKESQKQKEVEHVYACFVKKMLIIKFSVVMLSKDQL